MNKSDLSVTNLAKKIVDNLINNSKELNLIIKKGPLNCTIIDAGIEAKGSRTAPNNKRAIDRLDFLRMAPPQHFRHSLTL